MAAMRQSCCAAACRREHASTLRHLHVEFVLCFIRPSSSQRASFEQRLERHHDPSGPSAQLCLAVSPRVPREFLPPPFELVPCSLLLLVPFPPDKKGCRRGGKVIETRVTSLSPGRSWMSFSPLFISLFVCLFSVFVSLLSLCVMLTERTRVPGPVDGAADAAFERMLRADGVSRLDGAADDLGGPGASAICQPTARLGSLGWRH
jgi:hypothetical protein